MQLLPLFDVLNKGVALTRATTWKQTSVATALVTSLLTALIGIGSSVGLITPDAIGQQALLELSNLIVSVVTLTLAYLGVATDPDLGIKQ